MFVITNENNAVVAYGETMEYKPNGYPYLVDEDTSFVTEQVSIHEVTAMPEEVQPYKFCYTEEQGFYENPDYVEPNPYGVPDETVQAIKDDTIMDLIELGVL